MYYPSAQIYAKGYPMKQFFFNVLISLTVTSSLILADGSKHYALKTGKQGDKLLQLQQKSMEKVASDFVKKSGLKEGDVVWDLGCGTGTMTDFLAITVGEKGHVYAVDISKESLDIAKEKIEKLGIKNVTFLNTDIESMNFPENAADLVYSRFVFMHLSQREKVLSSLKKLLKSSGVAVFGEATHNKSESFPPMIELEKWKKTMIQLGACKGGDYNFGEKLTHFRENEFF